MENSKTKVGIIGYGEIGSSLAKVYHEKGFVPMIRDLDINTIRGEIDVLNICLPYGKEFVNIVNEYIDEYLPKIKSATIVIHDPTELKEPVLEALKRFKIITIRETVSKLLTKEYNLSNRFLYHPFYEFPKTETTKTKAISLSRVISINIPILL